MNAAKLLAECHAQGVEIELAADGKNLELSGPADVLPGVAFRIRRHKAEIIQHLKVKAAEPVRSAAATIIQTCKEYGVGLRLDGEALVVESNGRAWRSLICAIEAHADEIVAMLGKEETANASNR